MKKIKLILLYAVVFTVSGLIGYYGTSIFLAFTSDDTSFYPYEINQIKQYFKGNDITKTSLPSNEYTKEYGFEYFKKTDFLYPRNIKDLRSTLYEFFNSGEKEVEFYCAKEYKNCINDYRDMVFGDSDIYHYINFFVSPFNEYDTVNSYYDYDTNKIRVTKENKYTEEEIKEINDAIDKIYEKLVDPEDNDYNNIERIHDYIIYHAVYDNVKSDYIDGEVKEDSIYQSSKAYGPIIQGQAICTGYSALMALFLDRMGLENMRIASKTHAWNAVKINGIWYNIDLTWDDDKNDEIDHDYFLIDTTRMFELDEEDESHNYYTYLYPELNYER